MNDSPDQPLTDDAAQARWRAVEALFNEVIELTSEARDTRLDERCRDDADLRARVEQLLAADDQTEATIDRPAAIGASAREMAQEFLSPDDALKPGDRVGEYRLIELVGEGGMASVWLAERADGEFDQRVAIKVIRRGMDTDDILRRFQQERQLLAGLEHPGIGRLIGGGSTSTGRPYLVMEYIEGRPIDAYADTQRLAIRQRIELFQSVCDAVQFAHGNLVVHRDLKPSNILVRTDGQVKLLDFGIAKLVDAEPGADVTATGARFLTPRYASPEQVRGESMSTASDVYSLGVVLYELLTGHRPYELTSRSRYEIDKVICEHPATRPSAALSDASTTVAADAEDQEAIAGRRGTDSRRLRRQLAGDLDLIVLKALRKEPERRYASVQELAADLKRYLDGWPVEARPDTLGYRTGKFVRRNPALVASLVVLLLVCVGAATVSSWFALEATDARDKAVAAQIAADRDATEAKRQTSIAEAVNEYLHRILAAADPQTNPEGRELTMREAVSAAASDIETVFAGEPEVEAALHYTVGVILKNLGDFENGQTHLERSIALFGDLGETLRARVTDSTGELGQLFIEQGRFAEAQAVLEGEQDIARQLADQHPSSAGKVLNNLGLVHLYQGRFAEAEPYFREALPIKRQVYGEEHHEIATTMHNLGGALWMQGEEAEGEVMLRDAMEIRKKALGLQHPHVAQSINTLGFLLHRAGRLDDAEPYFLESLSMRREMYTPPHPDIGTALNNLANLRRDQGRIDEAIDHVREALSMWEPTTGDQNPNVQRGYHSLGTLLETQSRFDEAEAAFRHRVELLRRAEPIDAATLSEALFEHGRCLLAGGQPDEAESRFIEASEAVATLEDAIIRKTKLADTVEGLFREAGHETHATRWVPATTDPSGSGA